LSENRSKRLLAACCGMDLCWLCAWANFMTGTTTAIQFPLGGALAAFFLALGITRFYTIKNYRRIWPVLVHICCLYFLCRGLIFYLFDDLPPHTNYQWYQLVVVILLIGLFWYKGTRLANRAGTYESICNHFDLGISLLFLLTFIQFILELKVGIVSENPFTFQCIGVFFLFGLIALVFSYNQMGGKKKYLNGFRTYGILLSTTIILLLVSMGSFLLFGPLMTSIAESGYTGVKTMTGFIGPYINTFLIILLKGRGFLARNPAAVQGQEGSGLTQTFQAGLDDSPIIIGILILLAAITLCLFFYLIYRLIYLHFLRLFLKSNGEVEPRAEPGIWFRLLNRLIYLFHRVIGLIKSFTQNIDTANQGFVKLVKWGKRSGAERKFNETPIEYAGRLQKKFQSLEKEINTIIFAFEREVYGEITMETRKLQHVSRAVKTINSPVFWMLRIKSILLK